MIHLVLGLRSVRLVFMFVVFSVWHSISFSSFIPSPFGTDTYLAGLFLLETSRSAAPDAALATPEYTPELYS